MHISEIEPPNAYVAGLVAGSIVECRLLFYGRRSTFSEADIQIEGLRWADVLRQRSWERLCLTFEQRGQWWCFFFSNWKSNIPNHKPVGNKFLSLRLRRLVERSKAPS
jgi:hypothetical protein